MKHCLTFLQTLIIDDDHITILDAANGHEQPLNLNAIIFFWGANSLVVSIVIKNNKFKLFVTPIKWFFNNLKMQIIIQCIILGNKLFDA